MTPEYASQVTAGLLIFWFSFILSLGIVFSLVVVGCARRREKESPEEAGEPVPEIFAPFCLPTAFDKPCRWLAIRNAHPDAVQAVLRLDNAAPCTWDEGISTVPARKLFISPAVQGWIVVVGQGLPDPVDDVDEAYMFIRRLSDELGTVQFFSVNRAVNHHAWIWAENDRIIRAYAWAGETLWNQGRLTPAESAVEMHCYGYAESPDPLSLNPDDCYRGNADKVLALAARWSLDPTAVDQRAIPSTAGIVGELNHSRTR